MIKKLVQEYIDKHLLLNPGDKVIVGLSGGADSVALLHVLFTLGYDCVPVHCNFHLRGEESDRDALFVEKLCATYGLPYTHIDFDTVACAKAESISIEMAARTLRYTWFEEQRDKYSAVAIAVAHHLDDSVETVLLNLIRGTGIRGLTGISAKKNHVIRPFLCIARQQIEDYLADKNIQYVNDSTNSEAIYTRNKIRLHILPLMESINPSAKESIAKSARYLQQVQSIYLQYVGEAKKALVNHNTINIDALLSYIEPQAILYEILSEYDFTSAVVSDLYSAIQGESGRIFYSTSHKALKDRDTILISKLTESDTDSYAIVSGTDALSYPIQLVLERFENIADSEIERNNAVFYVDECKISYPLILRRWTHGDWFIPFGMTGKKKISDYFSDHKFNLFEKKNTWLLCSGNDIIWIVGHRSDDRYRVTADTTHLLKIQLIKQ